MVWTKEKIAEVMNLKREKNIKIGEALEEYLGREVNFIDLFEFADKVFEIKLGLLPASLEK